MKRTTLKHLNTLAGNISVEFSDMFRGDLGRRRPGHFTYSLAESLNEITDDWRDNYWYDGVTKDAMTYYDADCLDYLRKRGLDVSALDEDSDAYDDELYDQFKMDVTRAYCDASFQADETEFHRLVQRDIEDFIREVDAPYYTLLAFIPDQGERGTESWKRAHEKEVSEIHEATSVRFGFTRAWHKEKIDCVNERRYLLPAGHYMRHVTAIYAPDELEQYAEMAIEDAERSTGEYDIRECADRDAVVSFFGDYNAVEDRLLKQNVSVFEGLCDDALAEMAQLDQAGWLARTTRRIGL